MDTNLLFNIYYNFSAYQLKMLFEEDTANFKDFQNVSNLDPGIERIIKGSF